MHVDSVRVGYELLHGQVGYEYDRGKVCVKVETS